MRVVVTGATGNIGTSVVQRLAREPQVTAIVALARHQPDLASLPRAKFVRCDVACDYLVDVFQGAQAVIHLAWTLDPTRSASELEAINVGGSGRVFDAVARANVPQLLVASSVGSYAPGPKDPPANETWPTTGVSGSTYSRQKAAVERLMDHFECQHPGCSLVRLRPTVVCKRAAGLELKRFFLGRPWPRALFRRALIPFVPRNSQLRLQAVHSSDVAEAFRLALLSNVRGVFNLAADPVLDARSLAGALGKGVIPVPTWALRAAFSLAYRLRWQPADPSWLDLLLALPLVSSDRARAELGWAPTHSSLAALLELFEELHESAEHDMGSLGMNT